MSTAISRIAVAIWLCLLAVSNSAAVDIVTEEFMVAATAPGIKLYVRNKHLSDMKEMPIERILLYVHGSTLPSEATFDLELDGSWMDYIARRGWDVYLMEVRGYGQSTRPPEFAQPEVVESPVVGTDLKIEDVGTVVDFILKRRDASAINLVGWSWGTVVMAGYAAKHGDKVNSLVLYAPVWCEGACRFDPERKAALATSDTDEHMAPIVKSSMDRARKRLQAGAPLHKWDELMPPDWFKAWSVATLASDPVGASQEPPVWRVPAGVSLDAANYWDAGWSYYDPEMITAPTLIIVGEWDSETPPEQARALYEELGNSRARHYVELKEGTHLVLLEKNRPALFEAVQQFLEEVPVLR